MGFYSKHILPSLIHTACKMSPIAHQRRKVIPRASGHVLEIGIGSGLNLDYYDNARVDAVIGLDPSIHTWEKGNVNLEEYDFKIIFTEGVAEAMPFEDNVFDSVVVTYTLCSISKLEEALGEIRRVMRDDGVLLFTEHGLSPHKGVRRIQYGIEPVWKIFSGGCVLSRDMPKLITDEGFAISDLQQMYIPGWRPASYNYWGTARRR